MGVRRRGRGGAAAWRRLTEAGKSLGYDQWLGEYAEPAFSSAGEEAIQTDTPRGVAQLGLERLVRDQEVVGSNPITPIEKPPSGGFFNRAGEGERRE